MSETLSALDGILKNVYADYITDQVGTFSGVQEIFEKVTDAQWEGRKVIEAAIMSYNEGVGAIAEDANLPTAGAFDPQQFEIPMRYLYASFQMTAQMMRAARTSKGAFKNATRVSMDTLIRNLKREQARMLWGHGKGILALVDDSTPSGSTTLEIDAPGGIANDNYGSRFIRKGMILGFVNPSNGALRTTTGGRKVSTATATNGLSIVLDSAAGADVADNDYIVRGSLNSTSLAVADTGYDKEPMGLTGLVDDGTNVATYFNLSRTTYPQLKSRVASSVGALSLDAIQQNFDYVEQQHDAKITHLACEHAVRRAYLQLLEADRRYSGADLQSPDGGTKVTKRSAHVTFGGVPIIEDSFAPYGYLYGLDKSTFRCYVQVDGEWADESGAILRQVSGKDTWQAFYRRWLNYFCDRPGANFVMQGITVNNLYVPKY